MSEGMGVGDLREKSADGDFYRRKFDMSKARPDLLPFDALEKVAEVLAYGAQKYEADSWRLVPNASERYLAALLRHLIAYKKGETTDAESGLTHLSHLACNALFLVSLAEHPVE